MAVFETRVAVGSPVDSVFDFLLRPANAVRISPPDLGLVLVEAPEIIVPGSRMSFKVQRWGQVISMLHEIVSVTPPSGFVEQQVNGPFRSWVHHHLVEPTAEGTVIIDRIEFEPPGGLIGLLVTRQKILEQLEDGFAHRHEQLQQLLGTT